MGFNVQDDQPLILRLTLPEADDSKHVKAIVRRDNGTQLTGSPFTLNSIGGGQYLFKDENNLIFPAGALEVSAKYEIYDDAGFLVPTVDFGAQAEDVFRKIDVSVDVDAINDAIEAIGEMINDALILRDDVEILVDESEEAIQLEIDENTV